MSSKPPRLYDLLPAYVRFRDQEADRALETIFDTLQIPFDAVRADVESLYHAWFIETCDDWMVPYIGDLLGVRGLERQSQLFPTARTRVANALAYRRRSGTPAALERAARDVTGWPCHVVEYRRLLATAPHLGAGTPPSAATANLRRTDALEGLGGPFDQLPHFADFKPSDLENPPFAGPGGYSLQQLGLAFWRLDSYPIAFGSPAALDGSEEGQRFTFHPFGLDASLFNLPRTADDAVYSAGERHLPGPLRSSALAEEIGALRAGGLPPASDFFGPDPVFRILVSAGPGHRFLPLAPRDMEICDLSDWQPNPVRGAAGRTTVRALVDPVLGRFLLPAGRPGRRVKVDYCYGAAADLGGGPYSRPRPVPPEPAEVWQALVVEDGAADATAKPAERPGLHVFPTLATALAAWNDESELPIPPPWPAGTSPQNGRIRICDNATHHGDLHVHLDRRRLTIEAADGCRPTLLGSLSVRCDDRAGSAGTAPPTKGRQSELHLDGLWIEGGIRLRHGMRLTVDHCTVAPPRAGRAPVPALRLGEPGEEVEEAAEGERFEVLARSSVLGPLSLGGRDGRLGLADCVVDAEGRMAVSGSGTALAIARCTVLGSVVVREIGSALDTIFTGAARAVLTRDGETRFCYLPAGSRVPAQERCLGPGAAGISWIDAPNPPAFTSVRFGHPAYLQLSPATSAELRRGAQNGNEIGVFNGLRQTDRLDNLPCVLDELLPWGMTARAFFVT